MKKCIIVINSGSTSLKFAAYAPGVSDMPTLLCRGDVDEMQTAPRFSVKDANDKLLGEHQWGKKAIDHMESLSFVINWIENNIQDLKVIGAGHRIVLGGERFAAPTFIEGDVLDYLDSLSEMEPSHQSFNVAGARALAKTFSHLPQVACFDTSFHRHMPEVAQVYALPEELRSRGIRHWGYHGISYDYISRQAKKIIPEARRVIIAHLGGGASICALLNGVSVDTSMGFAALSGLPMATRSGDLSAGIIFYLLRTKAYDSDSLENLFYHQSGLLGLSGISSDMQTLLESKSLNAKQAIDYFAYQVVKYVGAYTAVLGGLDAFIFTAGIGENASSFRQQVCQQLNFLNIDIDEAMNAKHGPKISTANSKVSVWVIPTNEELMIAMHTIDVLRDKKIMLDPVMKENPA